MFKKSDIIKFISHGEEIPIAMNHYSSRGQTSVQKLYLTEIGKLFLKKVSDKNHHDCRIDTSSGTLAEREFWANQLAKALELKVPDMYLLDENTTVQTWYDIPDASHFVTDQGPLDLHLQNVFECACFDWITGQQDRHDANYLYDYVNEKIILIDSAHSFLKHSGALPDYLKLFERPYEDQHHIEVQSKLISRLKKIKVSEIVPLRCDDEKNALLSRVNQILDVKNLKQIYNFYRGR